MMHLGYLGSLLFVISLLAAIDHRYKLAFFYDRRRATKTILGAVGFFLVWDLLGVAMQIFYPGPTRYTLHVMILPRIPIEELLFLSLLSYQTLLLWRAYATLRRT